MTSIQRISASAVQLNPEINFSLFHGNFDFSLQKVEVPTELVPVGAGLSKHRRQLAEEGSFHILARRLGILFEEILPTVPSLLKAYGSRASEIAREYDKANTPPKSIADGIFGPHLGVDSTSIWAGATSGWSALLMHLLACMLARLWSPQEATAIWVELIEQRRQVVKNQAIENDRTSSLFARQAAMYEYDWASLQSWDASARAWLQIADNSRKRQQKQIELITKNLSVAVQTQVTETNLVVYSKSQKGGVHDSVIHNFCGALSTVDNLIAGKPQRIIDGGVLLGLTSWHLYPDLVILGPKIQDIFQKDALVAEGGVATLSIAYQEDPHGNQEGVYWSMSLANLRYYGVVECKRSSLHDSKLSISDFQALILGASLDSLETLSAAVAIISALWSFNYTSYQELLQNMQARAREPSPPQFTTSIHLETMQEQVNLSIFNQQTGEYELRDWMNNLHLLFPFTGGIDLLLSQNEADRKVALQLIRYGSNCARSWIGNVDTPPVPFLGATEVAVVLRAIQSPIERVRVLRETSKLVSSESIEDFIIRIRKDDGTWGYASLSQKVDYGSRKRSWSQFESEATDIQPLGPPEGTEWVFVSPGPDQRASNLSMAIDIEHPESQDNIFADFVEHLMEDERAYSTAVVWNFVVGLHSEAAIYTRLSQFAKERNMVMNTVSLPVIRDFLTHGSMDLKCVMNTMKDFFSSHRPKHRTSLLALGRIVDHHRRELSHLTIPMSIIKTSPDSWNWTRSLVVELEHQQQVAVSLALKGIITILYTLAH
ncbi:hypothetical protein BDV12DRAFT_204021 [Aspergillus spectabilis]